MTTGEPETTLVTRRECGCVSAAGHPDLRAEMERDARKAGKRLEEVPTGDFRPLPWACPRCDIGEAVKEATERQAGEVARLRAALELIAAVRQVEAAGWTPQGDVRYAEAALAGADLREPSVVEAVAAGTWGRG